MAEIPDLGEHCTRPQCNQLDFVPFRCDRCSALFCRNHRFPDDHECPVENLPNPQQQIPIEEERKFLCSMSACFQHERSRIQCAKCDRNFCMRHRICEDHDCPGLEKKPVEKPPKIQLPIPEKMAKMEPAKEKKKLAPGQQARLDRAQIFALKAKNPLKLESADQHFLFAHIQHGEDENARNGKAEERRRHLVVVSRQWSLLKALWHCGQQLGLAEAKLENLQAFRRHCENPVQAGSQNRDENEGQNEKALTVPLPLGDNVAKLLPNESEFILMIPSDKPKAS